MRGRDAVRKSTPKVDILHLFTIDFSEIQFIVNHNSQSDGQNTSAKSGMNLRKKTIHINSLQRKGGSIGLHLQVPRGGTHPNGVGSELTIFNFAPISLFSYGWFRLQSIAIHCNPREV